MMDFVYIPQIFSTGVRTNHSQVPACRARLGCCLYSYTLYQTRELCWEVLVPVPTQDKFLAVYYERKRS